MSLKPFKKIGFWVKIVVFAGLVVYIGHVLGQQRVDWTIVQQQIRTVNHPEVWGCALILLTPVNWGFESLKWYILLQRVEATSFWEAYKGVLAGVSLGFALPAQLGDTAGRVLSLRSGERGAAIGASLVSGGMQFYVAIVFGAVAWGYHIEVAPERNTPAARWLLILLVTLSSLGIGFAGFRRPILHWIETHSFLSRFAGYWNIARQYNDREIGLALGAAALRYLIFSAQFYLAMRLVGLDLRADISASGIGLVFLVKTITPAFNLLSDLGIREAASLWVFAPFNVPAVILLMATLTLWVANVLTPVLAGLIWVWKLKLRAE